MYKKTLLGQEKKRLPDIITFKAPFNKRGRASAFFIFEFVTQQ